MDRKVVDFRLAPGDISAIRFGISPGHELCLAVRVLASPQHHPLQWGWVRRARADTPPEAFELLRLVIGDDGYMPDFLTSEPAWDVTPALENDRLRRSDLDGMVIDLGKRAQRETGARRAALTALRDDPARARERIGDAWQAVWDAVMRPYWPTIERMLRADIGARSSRTATHGIRAMVDSIHESVRWHGDAVSVRLTRHGETLDCRGSGLVLVPSVMSRRCAALTEPPAQPALFYPALGVSETWTSDDRSRSSALAALLGDGRARVLRNLDRPLSTSEAAAASGIAVSTASHHLAVLKAARLVSSRRAGSAVLHGRTPLADALVDGVDR